MCVVRGQDDKWIIISNYIVWRVSWLLTATFSMFCFLNLLRTVVPCASHGKHVSKFNSWISDEFIVIHKFLFVLIHYELYEKSISILSPRVCPLSSWQSSGLAAGRPVWRRLRRRWFMSPITCKLSNWHLNTFNSRLDINQVKPADLHNNLLDFKLNSV